MPVPYHPAIWAILGETVPVFKHHATNSCGGAKAELCLHTRHMDEWVPVPVWMWQHRESLPLMHIEPVIWPVASHYTV